jgi:hypothetical protein
MGEIMLEHIWSVLCARSVIDSETNNVNIQDVIEQITIVAEPTENGFLPFPLELITLWGRKEIDKPASGTERVSFVTPSGKSTIISESKIDLSKVERHRQRVKMPGLPLGEAGRYYFRVEFKEDGDEYIEVAAIPLAIQFQPQKEFISPAS